MNKNEVEELSSSLHKNIMSSNEADIDFSFKQSLINQKNPVKISFNNLKYTVNIPCSKEEIQESNGAYYRKMDVLKNLSGFALPG